MSDGELVIEELGKRRIKDAWKFSRFLERAGQGNHDDLKKLLFLTYGRTGKRKRELIRDLIRPPETSLPEDEKALEDLIQNPMGRQALNFKPNAKFHSFLRSQVANSPAENPKAKIRHLIAKIPDENIWGRSVPLKLQKSLRKKWWANTLDKVLPPIPLHEFDRLRDLSSGKIPIEDPPPHRCRPKFIVKALTEQENDSRVWELLKNPARLPNSTIDEVMFDPELGLVLSKEGETERKPAAADKEKPPEKAWGEGPDRIRYMRRLYATIWNLTSVMAQDEVTKLWVTTWGGGRTKAHSGEVTAPSAKDEELFEGLEDEAPDPSQNRKNRMTKKNRFEENQLHRVLPAHQKPAIHEPQI